MTQRSKQKQCLKTVHRNFSNTCSIIPFSVFFNLCSVPNSPSPLLNELLLCHTITFHSQALPDVVHSVVLLQNKDCLKPIENAYQQWRSCCICILGSFYGWFGFIRVMNKTMRSQITAVEMNFLCRATWSRTDRLKEVSWGGLGSDLDTSWTPSCVRPRKCWRDYIVYSIWPGNISRSLGRNTYGLTCFACCRHNLNPDKQWEMEGWMVLIVFVLAFGLPLESIVTVVSPNFQKLSSSKGASYKIFLSHLLSPTGVHFWWTIPLSHEVVVHLHLWLWEGLLGLGLNGCQIPANLSALTVCRSSLCANSHPALYLFFRQGVVWSGTAGPQVQTSFLPLFGW